MNAFSMHENTGEAILNAIDTQLDKLSAQKLNLETQLKNNINVKVT